MDYKSKGKSGSHSGKCNTSMAAQKATLSVPASTTRHKNPDFKPVGQKAMTGAKYG